MDLLRISATAHGLNYLPEYYARASGGFEAAGIDVVAKARDPWTGVLDDLAAGSADLVLGGLWVPAMYADKARGLVAVGQLNARFPMALVSREPVPEFRWSWMAGHTVLVPGAGGTAPYEFTAGLMREAGVEPAATRFVRDLSTDMLVELYRHGLGDAILVDLLSATTLAADGVGVISARLAELGGPMPNSVYYTRRDRVEELHGRLVGFLAAIRGAMVELTAPDAPPPAALLHAEWPDLPAGVLVTAAAELAGNGTWTSIRIEPAACARWVSILTAARLVDQPVGYEDLVDTAAVDSAEALALD
jgi:NitT/TauT family transport system substrate-binding protein